MNEFSLGKAIAFVIGTLVVFVTGIWFRGRHARSDASAAADRAKVVKMTDQELHDETVRRARRR